MTGAYAEVIGDPIAHSLSPAIHRRWLADLGIAGDFRATRCRPENLPAYLNERAGDPAWRGCSVTMPLKEHAERLIFGLSESGSGGWGENALAAGAVNCILPTERGLVGHNTDVDGVAAALRGSGVAGAKAVIIGAGGAARAAIVALFDRGITPIVVARSIERAGSIRQLVKGLPLVGLDEAPAAIAGAAIIINATPMGMEGAPPMPQPILDSLRTAAPGAVAFEMVYRPLETPFLKEAEAAGLSCADGLAMLIGQARRAFSLFFGAAPPADDQALRTALIAALRAG